MSWNRTCCISTSTNSSTSYEYIDPSSSSSTTTDIPTATSSTFVYEQYLTSLKHEQSEHLPYLFDNIIYPQPCSPPSPTNDSITYYQLDQTHIQQKTIQRFQPIIYQQLSLIEPPSSNIQQKLPIVKRFYYDTNHANPMTTTVITTTPLVSNTTNDYEVNHQPYARLDSSVFGTYDIWKEKVLVGRKNHRRDIDVHMGPISVVSRIHFELILINSNEFHLKCLSKNGIFVNNNYIKMSATITLPKQCTLRFPSTDISITFSSLITQTSSIAARSTDAEQQIIYLTPSQQTSIKIDPELNSNFQQDSPIDSFTGSMNMKIESNHINSPNANISSCFDNSQEYQTCENDLNNYMKNGTKPPFSYAQLIVQAILSSPDKQMTLSQIYNFITAQYPYYESNNRGWQNSIRHNLSLNRYFIRLARKENECGKGSFWSLDETCEEKLIDHAYRHRKHRLNSHLNSSTAKLDSTDDFLVDIPTNSNSSIDSFKRKQYDDDIVDLMDTLLDTITNNCHQTVKKIKCI